MEEVMAEMITAHPGELSIQMPVLRPVPLHTRGQSWWRRTSAWLWDARVWEVAEDYSYTRPNGEVLFIPAGFRTDFASSPRLFWALGMDPGGILLIPSIFHDWGYRHDFYLDGESKRVHIGEGKRYHDRLLREISAQVNGMVTRSEERRVGKECRRLCRSRWSPYH
jgi:hypothetical protein